MRPELFDEPLPAFVEPCLATLRSTVPTGERWVHEIKWDGYRLQVRIENGKVAILTRRGHDWTDRFPAIHDAARTLPVRLALIDGEAVVEVNGIASFSALQAALGARDGPGHKAAHEAVFYAFDLLHLNGVNLQAASLLKRKEALAELTGRLAGAIRYSEHLTEDGEALFRQSCAMGLEGVISEAQRPAYRSGRGEDWIKVKCINSQEFVIAGYVPRSDSAKSVGALVLGYHDGGTLTYAGRVGTGFTAETARSLWKQLQPLRTADSLSQRACQASPVRAWSGPNPSSSPTLITEDGLRTSNCGMPRSKAFGRTRTRVASFGRVELRNLHRKRLPESLRMPARRADQPNWRDLLEQLVLQIRAGDPRDQAGHRLIMNLHYIEAARALSIGDRSASKSCRDA
jgi:DNA ligase D-like protein (predicted ligase)